MATCVACLRPRCHAFSTESFHQFTQTPKSSSPARHCSWTAVTMNSFHSLNRAIGVVNLNQTQFIGVVKRTLTLCGLIKASDLRLCFLAITKAGATRFSWKFFDYESVRSHVLQSGIFHLDYCSTIKRHIATFKWHCIAYALF